MKRKKSNDANKKDMPVPETPISKTGKFWMISSCPLSPARSQVSQNTTNGQEGIEEDEDEDVRGDTANAGPGQVRTTVIGAGTTLGTSSQIVLSKKSQKQTENPPNPALNHPIPGKRWTLPKCDLVNSGPMKQSIEIELR